MRGHDRAALAVVLLVAAAVAVDGWRAPTQWTPDGFFYRAQVLRVRGVPEHVALERVFTGPLTAAERRREIAFFPDKPYARKVANPDWVEYSSRFYERRWLVPVLAAALEPWLGVKGLRAVAVVGYVLLAALLYLLLRLFAPAAVALPAAAVCLVLAPLRHWAVVPQTDTWGIALETGALAVGVLVLLRGARWLPVWLVVMLALSFTRDVAPIAVAAALGALVVRRDRTSVALVVSGIATMIPAVLVGGAPFREALAYTLNGYYEVPDATWGFVADHYVNGVQALTKADLTYLGDHPVEAGVFALGILSTILLRARADVRAFVLAGTAASLLFLLVLPNNTDFRLELVTVPFVGLGLTAFAARAAAFRARA